MPTPLIRQEGVRAAVAVAAVTMGALGAILALAHVASAALAPEPALNGVVVVGTGLLVVGPACGWLILARPRESRLYAIARVVIPLAMTGLLLAAALLAVRQGLDQRAAQPRLGIPSRDVAAMFLLAAGAVLLLASILGAVPLPVARVPAAIVVAATAALGLAGLAVAAAVPMDRSGCEAFRFDPAAFRAAVRDDPPQAESPAEPMVRAIARCHVLDGLRRAQVRRRLGRPDGPRREMARRTWVYTVATVDDGFLNPGRGLLLRVRFDATGHVVRTGIGKTAVVD